MADNTQLNVGAGGDTLATDDIGGIKYPRGKITLGADGVNDGDVSAANPLPVTIASTSIVQPISASGLPLPSGASTSALQTSTTNSILASLSDLDLAIGNGTQLTQIVDNLSANPARLFDGDTGVGVQNLLGVSIRKSGNGGSTEIDPTQIRALSSGTDSVSVTGSVATGGLTDTQLRATPVPISGVVTNANLDVALSTRTKPSDQQHTILDSGTLTSITNALPAGTNVIGHVLVDSGSITVNVISGFALESGGNLATIAALSKAEDNPSANGDTGIPALAVRKDNSSAVPTGSDGDYSLLAQDMFGNLMVREAEGASMRRAQELLYLVQMQESMATMLAGEQYSSQRMGFEIR